MEEIKQSKDVSTSIDPNTADRRRDKLFYSDIFSTIHRQVLDKKSHLFSQDELQMLGKYDKLSDYAQRCFVRLFLRNPGWIRVSKLDYPEIGAFVHEAVKELHSSCYTFSEDILQDLKTVLDRLSIEEIAELEGPKSRAHKSSNKRATSSTKEERISNLLKISRTQKSIFGSMQGIMLKKAKKLLGPMVHINIDIVNLIRKAHLSYFCYTSYEESTLKDEILTFIDKRKYATYLISNITVFKDRSHLSEYDKALRLQAEVLELLDSKQFSAVEDIYEENFKSWESNVRKLQSRNKNDEHPLEIIFSPSNIMTKVLSMCTHALGRLKKYNTEAKLLYALLDQNIFLTEKRGRWWSRLLLILERYIVPSEPLKENMIGEKGSKAQKARQRKLLKAEQAKKMANVAFNALDDTWLTEGHRMAILNRLKRVDAQYELKLDFSNIPDIDDSLSQKIPVTKIQRERLLSTRGKKSRWRSELLGGDLANEIDECSVEHSVLEHYAMYGWSGYHSEGGVFSTIFALLFFDIIFMNIPGVFQNPYQVCPFDMETKWFYKHRKEAIDNRLKMIETEFEYALTFLSEIHSSQTDVLCIGLNWQYPLEDLLIVCRALGPTKLSGICGMLGTKWKKRSGLPDLVLFKSYENENLVKLVEVKGPGDRLMDHQKVWLEYLFDLGLDVELCLVSGLSPDKEKKAITDCSTLKMPDDPTLIEDKSIQVIVLDGSDEESV